MNKQDNKLALSVITTLISGIALIYTLIIYHHIIFAVVGMSAIFLISAYILTQNIIAFSIMKNKSLNVQLKDCINDISSQLEAMNGAQSQIGKATFLYTKQAAQTVATLESNYAESQEALYKNLTSLSNAQNKATKLMIKYDQNNTTKVISTIKELRNQLSDTMIQGFDQIQPNNDEVVAALEDIVNYLKAQPKVADQTLSLQLKDVAHELQNISNSIQRAQVVPQTPVESTTPVIKDTLIPEPETNIIFEETASEETTESETAIPDQTVQSAITEQTEAIQESAVTPLPEKGANDMLSADEIASLFAAAEPAPKKEEKPSETAEEPIEETMEEPFTPTFTVVGKSDEQEEESVSNITTIGDLSDDPNKQLSPDEIAALFAAAEPAPKKEEKPVTEAIKAEPVLDDPNKQLSPDEIAALFAAAEPAPKKSEESEEEQRMDEALAQSSSEPIKVEPISDDPNKQLSPDEIAALFASLG